MKSCGVGFTRDSRTGAAAGAAAPPPLSMVRETSAMRITPPRRKRRMLLALRLLARLSREAGRGIGSALVADGRGNAEISDSEIFNSCCWAGSIGQAIAAT